jgi:hypothetical protein
LRGPDVLEKKNGFTVQSDSSALTHHMRPLMLLPRPCRRGRNKQKAGICCGVLSCLLLVFLLTFLLVPRMPAVVLTSGALVGASQSSLQMQLTFTLYSYNYYST